jgi:polo-like kinase 1
MNAAAKAGKLARAPADLGKGGVPGDAVPGAPVAAPLAKEIPEVLVDPRSRRQYVRGRFLGKGGFAKCFEISDADTKEVFAGKIVPKSLLLKPHQKEKMSMEISIHRSLAHQHVVGFHDFFEDSDFVFVVLELCRRRVSVSVAVLGLPHLELADKGAPRFWSDLEEWLGFKLLWKGF